ncbi:MAG: CapA family protein [Chlamydiales bacterium]
MAHKEQISIGMAGDVMIGRLVNDCLNEVPLTYLWGDLLPLFKSCDLNLINLEAALTKNLEAVPKVFNFKADPEKVLALIEASVHVVNLANNHVLDYSEKGLLETLETLDRAHILHVGAGRNAKEAKQAVIVSRQGIRIGFLGCTDNEPSWMATQNRPGIRFIDVGDLEAIEEEIKQLRPQVDLLILSMHWGPNMRERPPSYFVDFAHRLIETGVDIIHGHSAHIFQGVEFYKEKLILYDTGDFVDDYYVDPYLRNDRSFFFIVEADKQGMLNLRLVPVLISNCQVNRAQGKEASETLLRMKRLSEEMKTALTLENGELTKKLR